MEIIEIIYKAGLTWDRLFYDICQKEGIPFKQGNSHVDIEILVIDKGKVQKIAVEMKGTDLHESLVTKEIKGNLRWELKQYYLPKRAKHIYDDVWLFVAPYPDMRDGVILDSICAEHRIIKKSYFTQDSAVKGVIEFAKSWEKPIDLSMPEYINMSNEIDQLSKSLRIFPGFTEEYLQKIREYRDVFNLTPAELLEEVYDIIEEYNPNLARLWYDWYYGGIEPKNNKLGEGV